MNWLKKAVNEVSVTFRPLTKYPFPPKDGEAATFEDERINKEIKKEREERDQLEWLEQNNHY